MTDLLFAMNNFMELGIQKVIITLLNDWDRSLGETALSVHNREGRFSSHVNNKYQIYELEKCYPSRIPWKFLTHTIGYYKLLKHVKPGKVVAVNQAEALSLCIVKRFYPDFKLVVCEHCNITESIGDYRGWFGWYYRHFFRREYKKFADVIHTVSFESKDDMVQNWGFDADMIKVIYNPVMIDRNQIPEKKDHRLFRIVTASRLEKQKRLDIFLKGLNIFRRQRPDLYEKIEAKIIGDGTLRRELEDLCSELGLNDRVSFCGFCKDPWKQVAEADLFVSSSEWEGLSVSLIEAQTVHTPVLASDCPSGNKEILMNGKAGKLFRKNDPSDFAEKLIDILDNTEQLSGYVRRADENIDRFSLDNIMRQYAEI